MYDALTQLAEAARNHEFTPDELKQLKLRLELAETEFLAKQLSFDFEYKYTL